MFGDGPEWPKTPVGDDARMGSGLGSKTVDSLPADLRAFFEALDRLPLPEAIRARIVGLVEGATASAGEG